MPAIYFESERLWFRAPDHTDVPFFTQALQNPEVRKHLLFGRYPFSELAEARWLDRMNEPPRMDGATDVVFTFGIKDNEAPLGNTGLHGISALHRHAGWGVFIGLPEEWGKGYGREVARAMLRYAFDTLNLHRVELSVNADNERGIRAYRAAGFKEEGIARQHVFLEGRYVDMLRMAALRDEWREE